MAATALLGDEDADPTGVAVAVEAHAEIRAAEHSSAAIRVARTARGRSIETAIIVDVRAAPWRRFPVAEG
jgi:hypothetical protein